MYNTNTTLSCDDNGMSMSSNSAYICHTTCTVNESYACTTYTNKTSTTQEGENDTKNIEEDYVVNQLVYE